MSKSQNPTDGIQSGSSDIASAIARLNKALEQLDKAVDASIESRHKVRSSDEEVQRMADDRAKLARELDASHARANRLAETNKEVSHRLVGAMETVRQVMEKSG